MKTITIREFDDVQIALLKMHMPNYSFTSSSYNGFIGLISNDSVEDGVTGFVPVILAFGESGTLKEHHIISRSQLPELAEYIESIR